MRSSSPSQDAARWQFCSTTQVPSATACNIQTQGSLNVLHINQCINVSYKINTVQLTLYSMSPIVLLWYTCLHNHFLCYRSLTLTQGYCLQTFAPWPWNDEVKFKTIIVRQICTFQALVSKLRINKLIQYFFLCSINFQNSHVQNSNINLNNTLLE